MGADKDDKKANDNQADTPPPAESGAEGGGQGSTEPGGTSGATHDPNADEDGEG